MEHRDVSSAPSGDFLRCLGESGVQLCQAHRLQAYVPIAVCGYKRESPEICAPGEAAIKDVSILGMKRAVYFLNLLLGAICLGSCETTPQGIHQARIEMAQHIAAEPAGDYFIGRRYYKPDFKFWGYIRRPAQPWSAAQLVMLNEKDKLAPDRERLEFGSDNNYEYKLYGSFSGQTVYEPASNGFYPEFILKRYELISSNPGPIFRSQMQGRPTPTELRYTVEKPE